MSSPNKTFLKMLLHLAPPIIFQEVLGALVNIMDTIMIGINMGIHEITAVGLANQIFFLFILVLFGVISGCSVFIGQFWGKKDKESIYKIMGIGFSFNLLVSSIFFFLAFFMSEMLMSIYSNDPTVIALGAKYLRLVSVSYFFVAIVFTRNAAMRSIGETKIPMITTSIALICNLVFNYILIFIFNAGVIGVAIGTVAARFIELVLQQIFIYKLNIPIKANLKQYFSFDIAFVRSFFKVSIFIILNEVLWSFGVSSYNIAYGYVSTEAQGAVQISASMLKLFQVFGNSMAITSSIIISNTLGSGDTELAIKYSRKCIFATFAIGSIMAALLILLSSSIVGVYSLNPQVEYYTIRILRISAIGMVLKSINFTNLVGVLRSGGDTKFCFYLEILAVWLVGVPLAFMGAIYFNLSIYMVILLVHMEEVIKLVLGTKRVYSNKWAKTIV